MTYTSASRWTTTEHVHARAFGDHSPIWLFFAQRVEWLSLLSQLSSLALRVRQYLLGGLIALACSAFPTVCSAQVQEEVPAKAKWWANNYGLTNEQDAIKGIGRFDSTMDACADIISRAGAHDPSVKIDADGFGDPVWMCFGKVTNPDNGAESGIDAGRILRRAICPATTAQHIDQPSGSVTCTATCPKGQSYDLGMEKCMGYGDRTYDTSCNCKAGESNPNPGYGNPIYPLTGTKRQSEDTDVVIGGTRLSITYDTSTHVPDANSARTWATPPPASFGSTWQSSLHKSITLQSSTGTPSGANSTVAMMRGDAVKKSMQNSDSCSNPGGGSSIYVPTVGAGLSLTLSGTGSSGTLVDAALLTEEAYSGTGDVTSVFNARGGVLTYTYTSGLLTSVADSFGRMVQFIYEASPGPDYLPKRIKTIIAPDQSLIQVGYDASNNLKTLTWADGKVRTYLYERLDLSWALTGIQDENGTRYSTYEYDSDGRASGTSLAGGVNQFRVTYAGLAPSWNTTEIRSENFVCREHRWTPPSGTQVTNGAGQATNLSASLINGMTLLTGQDQPAGSGSEASSNSIAYDSAQNVIRRDDFNGNRTCFAYDTTRSLPTVTLGGLAGGGNGKACPADLASYAPSTADVAHPERKVTTAWHPDWELTIRQAGPKKITTWVYNGQPDPIVGGTANCAPTAPTLPDGKPIAVICARYEQATTDTTGAQGFSATVSGATRAWLYTYNQFGQVLTETSPKLSPADALAHTTTYEYYTDTSMSSNVGHTIGDLKSVTNPLQQTTTFTSYDGAGRLLSSSDANGVVTTQTYWPRGWLKSQTVTPPGSATPQVTSYAYWPTGLLKTVTLPDTSTLNYTYDDAHRLTDVTDSAGNKMHYVLDNVGNHTSEQVSDASGNLATTVTRVFDALNRVQSQTGLAH